MIHIPDSTLNNYFKCDAFYNKDAEAGILYNDAALNIDWQIPADKTVVSDKDLIHPSITNCKNNYTANITA